MENLYTFILNLITFQSKYIKILSAVIKEEYLDVSRRVEFH